MTRETEDGKPGYLRIIGAIHARPWAIQAADLEAIIAIVEAPTRDLEAVAAKVGKPLDNASGNKIENRDGTAVLTIEGPIFRYANVMTRVSGATSVQQLALDFQAAIDDPAISNIMLNINSPGGQVDGISELADRIRAGNAVKPVTAYVSSMGASGAYWLAAAAGKIVANESAFLGSIGVIASISDNRGAQERQGVKRYEIVSSQSPMKNQDPGTDAGRSAIQTQVDSIAQLFIERMAKFRGVSVEKVSTDFGKGGVFSARDAIAAGMADNLGDYEGLVAQLMPLKKEMLRMNGQYTVLSTGTSTITTTGSLPMTGGTIVVAEPFDEDELEEDTEEANLNDDTDCQCPPGTDEEDCDCDENEDESEGTEQEAKEKQMTKTAVQPPAAPTPADERGRIAAILNCEEAKGREKLAQALALETNHTPEEAKRLLLASPVAKEANALQERMTALGNPKVQPGAGEGGDDTSTAGEVARILAFVPKDRKVSVN